jgi:hypothetical protein
MASATAKCHTVRVKILTLPTLILATALSCSTPPPGDFTIYDACGPVRQACVDGQPVAEERLVIDGVCTTRAKALGNCTAGQACIEEARECTDDGCISARCVENRCAPDLQCADLPARCEGDIAISPSGRGTCDPRTGQCSDPDATADFCAETGRVCEDGACVVEESVCDPRCGDDEVCRDNRCVDPDACVPACGALQECRDGRCVDAPPACNPPCEDGQRCVAGSCEDRPDDGVFTAQRYAAHQFVAVSDDIDLGGLGALLSAPAGGVVTIEGPTATCATSGTACLRFDYGAQAGQHIQTLCIVCVADEGDCADLPPATLDLEPGDGVDVERANFLTSGAGTFYRVCQGPMGLRVQIGDPLPPLMIRIIDAFGPDAGGSVARGGEDMELGRATALRTRSGEDLTPGWHTIMGHELAGFDLAADGSISVDAPVCDTDAFSSIECASQPAAVGDDDVFTVSTGAVAEGEIDGLIRQRPDRVAALAARHGSTWWDDDLSMLLDEASVRRTMVQRWLGMDLFRAYATAFDARFDLRDRGVRLAFFGHWAHRAPLSNICHPDETVCVDIEAELQMAEATTLDAMRNDGFAEIWLHAFLRYGPDGPTPVSDSPPHFSSFDGVVFDVNTNANPPASQLPVADNLTAALAAAATELGDLPVIVSPWAGPMEFYVEGEFCEASTCLPDFARYYAINEAVLAASMEHFGPSRVRAFVVPLFDGDHFDIDAPLEGNMHRSGETGFNNPLLNPYLTR